jgi:hypothetical protein
MSSWPKIDPTVEYRGTSDLRQLSSYALHAMQNVWIIRNGHGPIAVVIPYERFLAMQEELDNLKKAISSKS